MKDFDYTLIDNYLNNELKGSELALFEEKLKNDPSFANEVKLYKDIETTLTSRITNHKQENDLRNTLEDLGKEFISEKKAPKIEVKQTKVFSLKRYSKYLVAASLVLFATLLYHKNSNPNYSDFAKHETLDLVVRGHTDTHLTTAQNAFNAKNYKVAEKELRAILYADHTKVELQLYLGICLLEQNKFSKAETILAKIANGNTIYKNKANWYLALSKLKQKDYKNCKQFLLKIPTDFDQYVKVKSLLRKL